MARGKKNKQKKKKKPAQGSKPPPQAEPEPVQEPNPESPPEDSKPTLFPKPDCQKESALEYVNMIRKEFSSTPEVYTEFTQVLKDFDSWKISTDDFITKVCNLFSEKPNLVTGLNRFLPTGFEITKCDDGVFRCKMIPAFKKNEKRIKTKVGQDAAGPSSSSSKAPGEEEVEDEEDEDEEVEDEEMDFIYDVRHAQELYKNYCKERRSRNVEEVIAKGKEIREIVVPLLQWLEPDYFTDTKKGLVFTKMIRCIQKILMLEQRFKMFTEHIAPQVGEHAELVKTKFLNHHCMAYHRLVEGYMQTNELFPEDTPLAPDPEPVQGPSGSSS